MDFLGFMPDLFFDVAGDIGMKPYLYIYGFSLIHPEARPHELIKIEIFGDLESLLCLMKHFYPV